MLYLTCSMIPSVDFAHYWISRAKDLGFCDCVTLNSTKLTRGHYFEGTLETSYQLRLYASRKIVFGTENALFSMCSVGYSVHLPVALAFC